MRLQEKLQSDLSNLAKTKGTDKELIKVIIAELSRFPTKEVPDDEVIRIIKKMKANAIECGNLDEVPILDRYLPKMMEERELSMYIQNIISETGQTEMGKIMQFLKQSEYASLIDMKLANKIIRGL